MVNGYKQIVDWGSSGREPKSRNEERGARKIVTHVLQKTSIGDRGSSGREPKSRNEETHVLRKKTWEADCKTNGIRNEKQCFTNKLVTGVAVHGREPKSRNEETHVLQTNL